MNRLATSFALAALACNQADAVGAGADDDRPGPGDFAPGWEPPTYLPGEDPERVDRDTALMVERLQALGYEGPEELKTDYFVDFDEQHPQQADALVEKGAITALQGWGIKSNLAFQDGTNGLFGVDHCEFFLGEASCDDQWHAQAADTYIDTEADFFDPITGTGDLTGACGSYTDGNQWTACIQRYVTKALGGKIMKWRLIDTNCGDATQKAHIRAGIIKALSIISSYTAIPTDLNFTETTGGDWNYLFVCDNATTGAAAGWLPRGNLTLRYATADVGGPDWSDNCETSGLPGYSPNEKYYQATDMTYTYSQAQITLSNNVIFPALSTCPGIVATTANIRRGISNFVMHEMGHDFGLTHTPSYATDVSFATMQPAFTCQQLLNNAYGLHQYYRFMISDMDLSTTSGSLDIWDNDLSCFEPDGWERPTPGLGASPF